MPAVTAHPPEGSALSSPESIFAAAMAAFSPFEPTPRLAVAVSGGPDSRTLALLTQAWASQHDATVTALVVDHGLRSSSADEASETVRWLEAQGMLTCVLSVHVSEKGNLQQAAREARYAALTGWCRAQGVVHLLLGHHSDDLMETMLQRLIRGSGIDGLAAMAPVAWRRDVRLLRPLLGVTKEALTEYLRGRGQPWTEDPSNASDAFSRNRLRSLLPVLRNEGLSSLRLLETRERLHSTREFVDEELACFLARHVHLSPAGWVSIDRAALATETYEIALRALRAMLSTVRGKAERPRYAEVKHLLRAIRQPEFPGATLHGCRLLPAREERLFIFREHVSEPALPEERRRWDDRFEISGASPGLTLRALGADGLAQLRKISHPLPTGLPATLLHALPSVWRLDRCLAVPHIDYGATLESLGVSLRFAPRNPLC